MVKNLSLIRRSGLLIKLIDTKERKQKKNQNNTCQRDSIHFDVDCAAKGAQTPNFV